MIETDNDEHETDYVGHKNDDEGWWTQTDVARGLNDSGHKPRDGGHTPDDSGHESECAHDCVQQETV